MRLLVGVSGGVAAYKALEIVRLAVKAGHSVRVIQTPTSERFVGRASFQAVTGAPVLIGEFDDDPLRGAYPGEVAPPRIPISHLALVQRADAYLIAPATANTIAKLACGSADNLVTSAALAAACPVLVAPAMNNRMYLHSATQANVATLRSRGVTVVEPETGELASAGEYGIGRLADPAALVARCEELCAEEPYEDASEPEAEVSIQDSQPDTVELVTVEPLSLERIAEPRVQLRVEPAAQPSVETDVAPLGRRDFEGVKVVVTAGGTQEPIDAVRFIGNRSSGRMGYSLAAAAAARGAEVTLISANVALKDPKGVKVIRVRTAAELGKASKKAFKRCDVLLMAAAVADFRPAKPVDHKLKKDAPDAPKSIKLKRTEDVLATLTDLRRPEQLLIGFAAEHGAGALEYGRGKLFRKHLDAIVINDVSDPDIGFESADNEVTILTRDGAETQLAKAPKREIAEHLLDAVYGLRALTVFDAR